MRHYKKYPAYMNALDLSMAVLDAAATFPREEQYTLTQQLRRAAISVPSNIAGGAGRVTSAAFAQFLGIALGSLNEVDAQLSIASHLTYLSRRTAEELFQRGETTRISLVGLILTVRGEGSSLT